VRPAVRDARPQPASRSVRPPQWLAAAARLGREHHRRPRRTPGRPSPGGGMTTPGQLDDYATALVPLAARLVGAVRHGGLAGVRAVFDQLRAGPPPAGVHPPEALCVVLAALVDEGRPLTDLLAWTAHLPGTGPGDPGDIAELMHAMNAPRMKRRAVDV